AAAETAAGSRGELAVLLNSQRRRLGSAMDAQLGEARARVGAVRRALPSSIGSRIARHREVSAALAGRLNALSPLATLDRGYAVARRLDGVAMSSATDFTPDADFTLRLRDGTVRATARAIAPLAPEQA
nr:hypothetical protein [Gemmatimonadaceae bacterium]